MTATIPKKYTTAGLLLTVFILDIAATGLGDKPVNLKVLPKNISDSLLNKIMVEDCGDALGVNCDYCHVANKAANTVDYASDAKPEKDTARSMMRMTLELNRKYFGQAKASLGDANLYITCYTCHHGNPVPKNKEK
jgi:hypothetical protein